MPRLTADQLRTKALLALEDAVQECRYRKPRRSFAIRFALAYLWATSRCDRQHFDTLWAALGQQRTPWSHSGADNALGWIYRSIGVERPDHIAQEMWRRWSAEEGGGGPH